MAPKSKSKKFAGPASHKKRGKQTDRRKQTLLEFPPIHSGELSSDENEPSPTTIMNLLVDMNTRLATNKQLLDDQRAQKAAEEESRLQSPYLTHANSGTSRGTTRSGVMTGAKHADHEAIPEIADEVPMRVASCLRGAPALYLPTMHR